MPRQERHKTNYPGVYFILGNAIGSNKQEKIYYIQYRKNGKLIEEKAGRQFQDDMTPARAAGIRSNRIEGAPTNKERREARQAVLNAEANRWTLDRLWENYKESRPDLRGLNTDEGRWQNHLKPVFGNKEPHELKALDVDRLRVRLLKKLKPQTVRHVLGLLKRICRWGAGKGLCSHLDFAIQMPKVDNLVTEDLTPEQLSRLLEAIEADSHPHAGPAMKLALLSGLRRSELLRLQWDHVDFRGGFIRIVNPKGGKSASIPLNESAQKLLEQHPTTPGSPYVFPGPSGGQWKEPRTRLNRIKKAAGLPKEFRVLHGLRHTYASILASSGKVDLYTLQKLLTHKSPSMTQRYAHLRDDALKAAANVISDSLHKQNLLSKDDKKQADGHE